MVVAILSFRLPAGDESEKKKNKNKLIGTNYKSDTKQRCSKLSKSKPQTLTSANDHKTFKYPKKNDN